MISWPSFVLPPINLYNYPKQYRDYKMSNIDDTNLSSHYETHVRPQWVLKDLAEKADDIQIEGDHYKTMGISPWELMESVLTQDQFIGFLKGNAIKYSLRDGKKEGALQDAEKARHYMAKLADFKSKLASEW